MTTKDFTVKTENYNGELESLVEKLKVFWMDNRKINLIIIKYLFKPILREEKL